MCGVRVREGRIRRLKCGGQKLTEKSILLYASILLRNVCFNCCCLCKVLFCVRVVRFSSCCVLCSC